MKIQLYIMDDHVLVIDGLRSYFVDQEEFNVVGTATDPRIGMDEIMAKREQIDIVLTDIEMPHISGLDICSALRATSANPKVVFLTYHINSEMRYKVDRSKADGLIYKNVTKEELFDHLKSIHHGVVGPIEPEPKQKPLTVATPLTTTELKVLYYIGVCFYTSKETAQTMFRSEETINSHRKNIMSKLGVHKTAELVRYAKYVGLDKNPPI